MHVEVEVGLGSIKKDFQSVNGSVAGGMPVPVPVHVGPDGVLVHED